MSRAVWTDTADYMILRCAACGMPHIVHRQMMQDGISCRDCGEGPLIPEGYAIMIDKRPADIIVKTQVDTSDLDKVQRMVDEIQTSVDSMIEKLTETKEILEQIAMKIEGMTLYMCNPEINKECDKRFCMYNTNAVDHLCECTSKKEFALKIGEAAVEKEYTPPV